MFVEMSRDELHGGPGWENRKCVWSPAAKENGSRWTYWSKILDVQEGDTIVHLRGIGRRAAFDGYSTASSNGYETTDRPPYAGKWGYSQRFHRAELRDFVVFEKPIMLQQIFSARSQELANYFDRNKLSPSKRNLFFVRQAGRLQCQNGAYLSDLDEGLFSALLDIISVPTRSIGQPSSPFRRANNFAWSRDA